MTPESNGNTWGNYMICLILGLVLGIAGTLTYLLLVPRVIADGQYKLVLPQDGALVVEGQNDGKPDCYMIPPEAINYIVDSSKAWTTQVTVRGLYRFVTVYVPSEEYLPTGSTNPNGGKYAPGTSPQFYPEE